MTEDYTLNLHLEDGDMFDSTNNTILDTKKLQPTVRLGREDLRQHLKGKVTKTPKRTIEISSSSSTSSSPILGRKATKSKIRKRLSSSNSEGSDLREKLNTKPVSKKETKKKVKASPNDLRKKLNKQDEESSLSSSTEDLRNILDAKIISRNLPNSDETSDSSAKEDDEEQTLKEKLEKSELREQKLLEIRRRADKEMDRIKKNKQKLGDLAKAAEKKAETEKEQAKAKAKAEDGKKEMNHTSSPGKDTVNDYRIPKKPKKAEETPTIIRAEVIESANATSTSTAQANRQGHTKSRAIAPTLLNKPGGDPSPGTIHEPAKATAPLNTNTRQPPTPAKTQQKLSAGEAEANKTLLEFTRSDKWQESSQWARTERISDYLKAQGFTVYRPIKGLALPLVTEAKKEAETLLQERKSRLFTALNLSPESARNPFRFINRDKLMKALQQDLPPNAEPCVIYNFAAEQDGTKIHCSKRPDHIEKNKIMKHVCYSCYYLLRFQVAHGNKDCPLDNIDSLVKPVTEWN